MLVADIWSKEKRSEVMSKIKGKDTKPELAVRSLLHRMGYRFTVNGPKNKSLPGRPDIVLPKYRAVVFIHGCFWHQHEGCNNAGVPKTRPQFWKSKLKRNVERDRRNIEKLQQSKWKVVILWECEIGKAKLKVDHVKARLSEALR